MGYLFVSTFGAATMPIYRLVFNRDQETLQNGHYQLTRNVCKPTNGMRSVARQAEDDGEAAVKTSEEFRYTSCRILKCELYTCIILYIDSLFALYFGVTDAEDLVPQRLKLFLRFWCSLSVNMLYFWRYVQVKSAERKPNQIKTHFFEWLIACGLMIAFRTYNSLK